MSRSRLIDANRATNVLARMNVLQEKGRARRKSSSSTKYQVARFGIRCMFAPIALRLKLGSEALRGKKAEWGIAVSCGWAKLR
eukprot:scaffold62514_cov63-Phaeocystis_antarctica.AAC.2